MNLPITFQNRIHELLSAYEYEQFIVSMNGAPHSGFRVNTLKISYKELSAMLEREFEAVSWCGEGFYYDAAETRLSKSPLFQAGLFYLQEPSAMLPVSLLPIEKGDIVLDLCASPGGKSTQIAAKLGETGALIANDANPSRISALIKNIEQSGITNCVVTNETPERLNAFFGSFFDKILIDAPCSGEGMFRRDRDSILAWDEQKPHRLSAIQRHLLENAAAMLKTGGYLAYSTCTFSPEENEQQISAFLKAHSEFEMYAINHALHGISAARTDWADDTIQNAARIFPHLQRGEGHFTAILHKTAPSNAVPPSKINSKINSKVNPMINAESKKSIEHFYSFCNNYLNADFSGQLLKTHKNLLYMPPEKLPDMAGLRVSRGGFCLGHLKDKRFEPSGALALGLTQAQYGNTINYTPSDERLGCFLRGDSIDTVSPDGFFTLCVNGFAIDTVKVSANRIKWRARR